MGHYDQIEEGGPCNTYLQIFNQFLDGLENIDLFKLSNSVGDDFGTQKSRSLNSVTRNIVSEVKMMA